MSDKYDIKMDSNQQHTFHKKIKIKVVTRCEI